MTWLTKSLSILSDVYLEQNLFYVVGVLLAKLSQQDSVYTEVVWYRILSHISSPISADDTEKKTHFINHWPATAITETHVYCIEGGGVVKGMDGVIKGGRG
jgi:hypothetical protein